MFAQASQLSIPTQTSLPLQALRTVAFSAVGSASALSDFVGLGDNVDKVAHSVPVRFDARSLSLLEDTYA